MRNLSEGWPPSSVSETLPISSLLSELTGKCLRCQASLPPDRKRVCQACDDEVAKDLAQREDRDLRERAEHRLHHASLPREYASLRRRLDDFREQGRDALAIFDLFGRVADVRGAYLWGAARTFKTTIGASYLAARLAEKDFRCGCGELLTPLHESTMHRFSALWVSAVDFMSDIYDAYSRKNSETRASLIDKLIEPNWLVIDDFAKEKNSEHSAGVWFEVFDGRFRRYSRGDWMIVTSNWSPDAACDRFEAPPETVDPLRHRVAFLTVSVPMEVAA